MDFSAAINPEASSTEESTATSSGNLAPVRARLAPFESRIDSMLAQAQAHRVVDEPTCAAAVQLGSSAKALFKAIEQQRKAFVKPHNTFVKQVNALCSSYQDKLGQIEKVLKHSLSQYAVKIEAARLEAERKAREEMRSIAATVSPSGNHEAPALVSPVLPEPKQPHGHTGTKAYTRKVWSFEIVDEAQLPREYLMPNEKLIRERVQQGVRTIPGVKVFQETKTSFRS